MHPDQKLELRSGIVDRLSKTYLKVKTITAIRVRERTSSLVR